LQESLLLTQEALAIFRALDNPIGVSETLGRISIIHLARSAPDEARFVARECLAIGLKIDSPPVLIDAFEALTEIALHERTFDEAVRYFGAARFLRRRHQWNPGGIRDIARIESELREAVGERYEALVEASEGSWREEATRLTAIDQGCP